MRYTAKQQVLIAAHALSSEGLCRELSQEDLTIEAFKRDPENWQLNGYPKHPDNNKVLKVLMSSSPKSLLRLGWLERVRPNYYRITPRGQLEAERLMKVDSNETDDSSRHLYEALAAYIEHPSFKKYLADPEFWQRPGIWHYAVGFLALKKETAKDLEDAENQLRELIDHAQQWMDQRQCEHVRRTSRARNEDSFSKHLIAQLTNCMNALQLGYARKLNSIRQPLTDGMWRKSG